MEQNSEDGKFGNPLKEAEFFICGKKVKESRFFKSLANDINPPKKRVKINKHPKPITTNIEQALINLEEYFDDRSDINKWGSPNPEMNLLNDVLVIKKYFGIE